MSEFDILEDLERELGPSLRASLQGAAGRITDKPKRARLHRMAAGSPALEPEGTAAPIVDINSASTERIGRRRWLVAAAAVAAVAVISGTVLVELTGDDGTRTRVATGPRQAVTTTVPTPATSFGLQPGFDTLMRSEGATLSSPETGELVAAAWRPLVGVSFLYADGRLISADDVNGTPGWVEQRLTPEGVERVRSEFLASGLFDSGTGTFGDQPQEYVADPIYDPGCYVCVRDGDRLLTRNVQGLTSEEDLLVAQLAAVPSSLPVTDWVDQQIKEYVPAKYDVCLSATPPATPPPTAEQPEGLPDVPSNSGVPPLPPLDLSEAMQALPPQAAMLLSGVAADLQGSDCFVVTTEVARVVANELAATFGVPSGSGLGPTESTFQIDVNRPNVQQFRIQFWGLLPDGALAYYYPAKH